MKQLSLIEEKKGKESKRYRIELASMALGEKAFEIVSHSQTHRMQRWERVW